MVLAAYAGLFAYVCLVFPYDAERLYRAVPPNAILISEHENLADRWPELVRGEPARSVWGVLGLKEQDRSRMTSRGVERIVRRLASRNTVVAYVPELGRQRLPAWIAASWIGLEGQFLRLGLYDSHLADFQAMTLPNGRRALVLEGGEETGLRGLALVVTEGVLLACFSTDPLAIEEVLSRVEGGAVVVPSLFRRRVAPGDEIQAPDRVWFPRLGADRCGAGVKGALTRCGPAGIEGEIHMPLALFDPLTGPVVPNVRGAEKEAGAASEALSITEAAAWLADAPAVLIAAPFEELGEIFKWPSVHEHVAFVGEVLREAVEDGSPALVCLCRQAYSGRILGFKTPTLVAACRWRDPATFEGALTRVLDGLNARTGWGLIPNVTVVNGCSVVSVQGVKKGIYGTMEDGEPPAFSIVDGWLVCASNGKTLEDLIRKRGQPTVRPARGEWTDTVKVQDGHSVVWADLPHAVKALTRTVAVYDLMWYARRSKRSSGPIRKGVEAALQALKEMEGMETAQAWTTVEGNSAVTRFRLGRCAE